MESGQDEPIRVKVRKKEQTPFERNLSQARESAIVGLAQAKSLTEFLTLSSAARQLTPQKLNWVIEQDEEYKDRSSHDLLADFTGEKDSTRFEEETKIANTLIQEADLRLADNKIQIVLTKTGDDQFPNYRALAVFPKGVKTGYDLPRIADSERDIIFMELNAPCNKQAADHIFGESNTAKFEIDNLSDEELRHELGFDLSGRQDFRHRDSSGAVIGHRDEKLYLLFAAKGGFSNEDNRYLVSDSGQFSGQKSD